MIDKHPTAHVALDTTADHPHPQRNLAIACRSCLTLTFRTHAVCGRCVDPDDQYGCCPVCAPTFFGATS